jgi:AcrR family transcriptional regulator
MPSRRRPAVTEKNPATAARGSPGAPRRPRQARGAQRVTAILDAAAALITESGIAGLTMQAIAERSGTASGSLYHFFPDRDAVLRGLAARHIDGVRRMLDDTHVRLAASRKAAADRPLSVAALVDQFLDPVLAYKAEHPDFGLVERAREWPGDLQAEYDALHTTARRMAEQFVLACDPKASPSERASRASMIMGTVQGTMRNLSAMQNSRERVALIKELKRGLGAYFASIADASRCAL